MLYTTHFHMWDFIDKRKLWLHTTKELSGDLISDIIKKEEEKITGPATVIKVDYLLKICLIFSQK